MTGTWHVMGKQRSLLCHAKWTKRLSFSLSFISWRIAKLTVMLISYICSAPAIVRSNNQLG